MTKPLYEQIFNHISERIMKDELKVGDRVPSEKQLAEHFNVSRITSKKALDLLSSNHIIERVRGKGSFVASKLPEIEKDVNNILIGAIFPFFQDCYGLKLQHTIEQKISGFNGSLIIKRSYGLISEEERAISSLMQLGVKGLIVFPVDSEQYNRRLLKLILEGFPVVVVDRDLKGILASTVSTDNKTATQQLTSYLFELGHQKIAFLSPPPERTSTVYDRLQGFQNAYLENGLRLSPHYLLTGVTSTFPSTVYNGHHEEASQQDIQSIYKLITENPEITAFVAVEYELAIMLTKVLKNLGKQIPEDCSITCFDCPDDPFDIPLFTHIRQEETEMGTKAVELLYSQIEGNNVPVQTRLHFKLIEGQSTRSIIN